ncbi:hypothetical protein [Streptomyces sp. NPDC050704]|uniref:hypothetical protein n=1 Tax=Streptomyces sp. NPDC050704 TaxID=3157219 RepID=UPI003414F77F
MLSDDELDRMLRNSDPNPGGPATDPDSPTATRILARVRRSVRRRRRRILTLAPVVALTVAGATAGTYAWVAGDGEGHTLDSTGLMCVGSDGSDAVLNFDPATQNPVGLCRQGWQEFFGVAAPGTLTACVDSSQQGSIAVYAGGRDQCASHRADPYVGPTREQLDFAHFRTDIRAHFAGRTCVPYSELRKVVGELFVKHDLTKWTTRHFQTADKEPEGPCAEVTYYDEPERTVWLGDHKDGDSIHWP